jgi:hypothetical protein
MNAAGTCRAASTGGSTASCTRSETELWPNKPWLIRDDDQPDIVRADRDPVLVAPWDRGGTVEAAVALTGSGGLVERRTFLFLTGAAVTAPAHQWLVHEPGPLLAALNGDRVTPALADRLPADDRRTAPDG